MSLSRLPDESFEAYKERRKKEQIATADRLLCCISCKNDPHPEKYGLQNRKQYRVMYHQARKEYLHAKRLGLTDKEILDGLYSGSVAQSAYAKFIENEIVGKV